MHEIDTYCQLRDVLTSGLTARCLTLSFAPALKRMRCCVDETLRLPGGAQAIQCRRELRCLMFVGPWGPIGHHISTPLKEQRTLLLPAHSHMLPMAATQNNRQQKAEKNTPRRNHAKSRSASRAGAGKQKGNDEKATGQPVAARKNLPCERGRNYADPLGQMGCFGMTGRCKQSLAWPGAVMSP